MTDKLTTRQAVGQVLTGKRKPMRVPAIIEAAVPISRLGGKTPGQTIYSLLYAESKRDDGRVVQTGKGEFNRRPGRLSDRQETDLAAWDATTCSPVP